MKRRMKRNKLLKKVLTLGLAAAVAVSSMAPTLAMMEPVVVKAAPEEESKEFIAYDLCELYSELKSEAEGTIHLNYEGSDEYVVTHPLLNGWDSKDDTFREIEEKMLADGFQGWTLKVTVEVADDSAADNATGDLQGLLFAMESSVQGKENWKGTNGEGEREQPIEIVKGGSNNLVFDLSSLSGYKELAQLGLRFDAKNKIADNGKNIKYTVTSAKIVTDKCKVTGAKEAKISTSLAECENGQAWTKNIDKVDDVGSVELDEEANTITVKAKLGDMEKNPVNEGGDVGHRAFPIVVELDSKATKCYKFKENGSWEESEDRNANARITDAWKCLNESVEPGNWATEVGKNCIVWLSEEWVGDGKTISFDETNAYTINVVDTTEYTIAPEVDHATVSIIKKDGGTAASSVTGAKVGDTYTITLTAEDGYYFDTAAATALNGDEWSEVDGKENLEYSKDFTVAVDYEELGADKKINPIPAGVTVTGCTSEEVGTVTIDYVEKKLQFQHDGDYVIDDMDVTIGSDKTLSITEASVGSIRIIRKATDVSHTDSELTTIQIVKAPAIPVTVKGVKPTGVDSNDGKIEGTAIDMEYTSNLVSGEWTACNDDETEVAPGTYYVRYGANNGSNAGFAGDATKIIVGEYGSTIIDLRISVSPTSQSKNYGVTPDNFTITVNNVADALPEGKAVITLVDNDNGFKALETTTLPAIAGGATQSITVKPAENLKAGNYSATLKIAYNDGSGDADTTNAEISVSFELIISKVKWANPTGTPTASSIQPGTITMTGGCDLPSGALPEYGYATDGDQPQTIFDPQENNTHTLTSVPAGTYYLFVRAKEDDNHFASDWIKSSETVTVAAKTPSTPSNPGGNTGGNTGGSTGGSSGGSSGGGSGSSGGTGTTPVVPAVTTTADGTTVSLNKDGAYVDKDGKPAANAVIKEPTGVMHITDATGHVVKNSIATTADGKSYVVDADGKVVVSNIAQINGNKYIAGASGQLLKGQFSNISGNTYYSDANGVVKTNGLFTVADKQYVADENGVIVKDKMTTLADGKKVYSGEDGVVVTNKMVTVDGKKYYAAKNGVIATKKIVKAGKKKYYATKTGAIATKKIVKAGGKKYYATKTGALATNKWVKVGNKKYYCNKKGVITKTKKVKK